jgi:hypothetical protein
MSPSNPDEQPTQDVREMNGNEGICELMMKRNKSWNNHRKNELTLADIPSAVVPVMMAVV